MTKSKSKVAKSATKKTPAKAVKSSAKWNTVAKTAVKKTTPTSKTTVSRSSAKKTTPLKKVVSKNVAKTTTKKAVAKKTSNKKEVKPESQHNMVLNHLVKKGSINTREAIDLYGVLRLGALVYDLRQGGMNIETSVYTFLNKTGRKSNVAKYTLQ